MYNQTITGDVAKTLNTIATDSDHVPCVMECYRESHYGDYYETEECNSLRACGASCGGGSEVIVVEDALKWEGINGQVAETLDASYYKGCGSRVGAEREVVYLKKTWCVGNGQLDQARLSDKAGALNCMHDQQIVMEEREMTSVVRRLTPREAERLQGFPDGWTDIGEWTDSKGKIRKCADTNRYKALGNSIALPYWKVLARRIAAQYDRDITMGSLFDGIGGFPLAFMHTGATPVWASEIEEFCIAVTEKRFGKGEGDEREPVEMVGDM